MRNEQETREKLLLSAKEEFLQKGYAKASLRNICKNAGVTTGALYFFFNDKEDLFGSLVKGPLEKLYFTMKNHYQIELNNINKNNFDLNDFSEDIKAMEAIVNYIFEYYDEFVLVLTKSQGSKYEKVIDEFIKITENHFKTLVNEMANHSKIEKPDDYIIHWIAHIQIFSFVELITHDFNKEESLKHMQTIIMFLINGWRSMIKKG